MIGWRTKFVFFLMVYFAGFATAIYFLAPVSDNYKTNSLQSSKLYSMINSGEMASAMHTGMHKAAILSKEIADKTSALIQQKIKHMQTQQDTE